MKKILFLLLVMALIPGSHPELFAQKKSRKAEVAAENPSNSHTVLRHNETGRTQADTCTRSITTVPVIANGEAQKIPAFENPDNWLRGSLGGD